MYEEFDPKEVAVIGLHTVFEHHSVMGRDALEVFVHEYLLRFPIGIDKYDDDQQRLPLTMHAYQMQGTPTLILIDKAGKLRLHKFGHISDLTLGFSIGTLLSEKIISTETPIESQINNGNWLRSTHEVIDHSCCFSARAKLNSFQVVSIFKGTCLLTDLRFKINESIGQVDTHNPQPIHRSEFKTT